MPRLAIVALLAAVSSACGSGGGGEEPACPPGQASCGGACVDLQRSAAHCGACGNACGATQGCSAGTCSCPAGTSSCDGECFDLEVTDAHCGACGTACPAGAACSKGSCLAVCSAPEAACGLACRDLSTDAASCGRCGRACAPGAGCSGGACVAAACTGAVDLPGPPLPPQWGFPLAVHDLDRDGILDLVVAWNAKAWVERGLGNGRFEGTQTLSFGAQAWVSALAFSDLDGDGQADLAVADRQGAVHLLRGQPDGSLAPYLDVGVGAGADGVAVADLDGDGHPDLAVSAEGQYGQGAVSILWNDGAGGVAASTTLGPLRRWSDVAIGELNGDGRPDVVASEAYQSRVAVFLGAGGRSFAPEVLHATGGNSQTLALADLDGDGRLDVVTSPGTSVALGRGDGTFGAPSYFDVGALSLAVVDLDGDAHTDIALAGGSLLLGAGDGTFLPATIIRGGQPSPVGGWGIAAGDLDGDGRVDLIFDSGQIVLQAARGGWLAPEVLGPGPPVAVGDVNGDGDPDVVVREPTLGLVTLLGRGDGSYAAVVADAAAPLEVRPGALADVDGDGRLDLVSGSDQIVVRFGDGQGGFTPGPSFATPTASIALAPDLDGDGRADLVTFEDPYALYQSSGSAWPITIRMGVGDGSFGAPVTLDPAATALAVADLDRDGALDVLAGRTGELRVFRGNGDGSFGAPTTHSILAAEPVTGIAVGDLDGDGVPDVLVTAWNMDGGPPVRGSFAARFLGQGGGALGAPGRLAALDGMGPYSPVLLDADGDGRDDLLISSSLPLALFRSTGGGGFDPAVYEPGWSTYGPLPVRSVADLDRDGRPDLIAYAIDWSGDPVTVQLRVSCRP